MVVSVVKHKNKSNLLNEIRIAINKVNYAPKREKVVIKPNIVGPYSPNSGIVTDPEIVGYLIDYLNEKGIEDIVIAESSRISSDTYKAFEKSGFKKMAEERKVKLINLNEVEREEVSWRHGKLKIPKLFMEREYINVPKLKTHTQTTVSLSMKNQKGILTSGDKKRFHMIGLHSAIRELANVICPDLILVDGLIGLQGDGPTEMGKKKKVGLLIASTNLAEVDTICCKVMGINPDTVLHLRDIKRNIEVKGGIVNYHFVKPRRYYQKFNFYLWPNDACSGCTGIFKRDFRVIKAFPYGFLKRVDFFLGRKIDIPNNHGKLICVGNCSLDFAQEHNIPCVKGCPPEFKDLIDVFGNVKNVK